MAAIQSKDQVAQTAKGLPFGLSFSSPVFERAIELAKALLGARAAFVALEHDGLVWLSSDPHGPRIKPHHLYYATISEDRCLWVEDARQHPEYSKLSVVAGPPYFRSFVSAPIRLSDGRVVGGLCVIGRQPKAHDAVMEGHLRRLADFVGDECDRAINEEALVDAMERIERSEQRLKVAVEIAHLFVWELDYQRAEMVTSGAEAEFFDREYSFEELAEDSNITIDARDRARIGEEWNRATLADQPYQPEYRTARSDGKEVWASCTVKLIKDDEGNPLRLVGAMRNITEQKKVEAALVRAKEEAEEANQAKSAFLATMSHEIRTPLNGVLGMTQAIAADALSPVQRERLEVVRQSGETLLAILNDVLDLSKIEAGKLNLEIAEFDIAKLARGAHAAFTSLANRKGLEFNLVIEPGARGVYRGDSTRIRQIVYNLVSNALKFTERGEVSVRVARDDEDLTVTIKDTGIGIPPDEIGRLFRKFEQADASTTRKFGGTGLGLAICRELAQLMGGRVGVDSAPGKGARFWVTLPLERIGDERVDEEMLAASDVAAEQPEVSELRVLCAEDNSVNQLVLKTLLHQAGIEPVIVEDGAQLVEAWRAQPWDILLVDVQMPVMDGPTATRHIRAEEARTGRARTPIIALTANAMAHQVAEYTAGGMDAVVAKPIEIARLFETMQRLLGEAEDQDVAFAAG